MLKISILNNRIQYNESEIGYFERMIFMLKKLVACISVLAVLLSFLTFSASANNTDWKIIESDPENCWIKIRDNLLDCEYIIRYETEILSLSAEPPEVIASDLVTGWECVRDADGWVYSVHYDHATVAHSPDNIKVISGIKKIIPVQYTGTESDITVPTEYKGIKITEFSDYLITNCKDSVKTIRIPKGITDIDTDFLDNLQADHFNIITQFFYDDYDGKNLQKFIVSKDNKNYKSVSGVLYTKSGKSLIRYPAAKKGKSFTVPSSVENILRASFAANKYLESLTISENVKSVGTYINYDTKIKKIYIKNTKMKKSKFGVHYCDENWDIVYGRVETIYVFKDSGAYDYYKSSYGKKHYKTLKLLSKPTTPKKAQIKSVSRTSKGVKIKLKEIK